MIATSTNYIPTNPINYPAIQTVVEYNFMMNRAVGYARNVCIPLYARSASISCLRPPFPELRTTTIMSRRTVMSSQWTSVPREFPTSGFDLIDTSLEIEEETLSTYQPERYYPVQQGEVLNGRYQVLAKLGYGVTSTVWFGRDLL